ncbi:hypothetical protein MRX96_043837 [Rhipicephalus microplus]
MDAVTVPSTSSTHYLDFMTNRWIPRFGVPSVIITDQAKGFVNKKTNQFHHSLGIAPQNSPPYWPQSNGLIERMAEGLDMDGRACRFPYFTTQNVTSVKRCLSFDNTSLCFLGEINDST